MKKLFSILTITLFFTHLNAQQEEYTAYLENARMALAEKDTKNFLTNLAYFSAAIEKENIQPEDLTDHNLELYTLCLNDAIVSSLVFPDEIAKQAIRFLQHEKDKNPVYASNLAYMYYNGFGTGVNFEKAFSLYKEAAEKGNAYSFGFLGNMYALGQGVSQSDNQAINWYEKGIVENDSFCMRALGYMFQHGYGVSKNPEKAM